MINVGELVATMKLDMAEFDRAVREAPRTAQRGLQGVTDAAESEGKKAGKALAQGLEDGTTQATSAAGKGGTNTGKAFTDGFAGGIKDAPKAAETALGKVGDAGVKEGTRAGKGLGDGVLAGAAELSTVGEKAATALEGVGTAGVREGDRAGHGIGDGITDGIDRIRGAEGAAVAALAPIGDAGITEGQQAGQGLAAGVAEGLDEAAQAAKTGGKKTGAAFSNALEDAIKPVQQIAGQSGTRAGTELTQGAVKAAESNVGALGDIGKQIGLEFVGGIKQVIVQAGSIFAGLQILSFFRDAKNAASDLAETIDKSGRVFGNNADEIQAWSETSATAMGLSQQAALEAAAGFGNMFQQIGFTGDQASMMSTRVVQMAADFGSFNNLPTADVLEKISGAFNGEYDSIQRIIPTLSAAKVEHQAMADTGKTSAAALTDAEKAQAVLTIATRDGANQLGNYAETASGVANTEKTMAAQFVNTSAELGQRLMPAWEAFLGLMNGAMGLITGIVGPVADMVVWFTQLPGPVQLGALAFLAWTVAIQPAIASMRTFIATSGGVTAAAGRMAGSLLAGFGGPIGLAILGVTAAIGIFMASTSDAEVTVANFADAIDQTTGKLKENADEALGAAAAQAGHIQAYKALGGTTQEYIGALKQLGPDQDAVHTRILDGAEAALTASGAWQRMVDKGIELSTNSRQVASDILATGDAGQYSSDMFDQVLGVSGALASDMSGIASESDKAAIKLEAAGDGAKGAGDKAAAAKTPMQNTADATKALGQAASDADVATQFLIVSLNLMNGGAINAQQAADLAAAAFRGIAQSQRDADQAQTDLTQANMDYATAAKELADVLGNGKSTQEEITTAQIANDNALRGVKDAEDGVTASAEDMRTANLKARDAAIAQASSAYTLAGANGDLTAAGAAATASVEASRAAFIAAQPQADIFSGKAAKVADELFGIPGDVATQLRESGAQTVEDRAKGVAGAVNSIPDLHSTTLTVIDQASGKIALTQAALDSMSGYKQIVIETVNRNVAQVAHLGGAFHNGGAQGLAGGGMPDVGAHTNDGIPVLAHRGEHMFDAPDVRRLGGQAGVYGFRDALTAGGAQAAAMWLLQRNGGLPGAMAPAAAAGPAQGNSGPSTVIQFGDVRVGEYRDAAALLNRAAYMGI